MAVIYASAYISIIQKAVEKASETKLFLYYYVPRVLKYFIRFMKFLYQHHVSFSQCIYQNTKYVLERYIDLTL